MSKPRAPRRAPPRGATQTRCKNLYRFIRLRLGQEASDRELARRWQIEWRSFAALKQGTRQVPRIEELERLAKMLGIDPGFVFQVARGVSAEEVSRLLEREQRLLALVERFRDGVFTMDPRGRIQDANPAMTTLVGQDPAELLSRSFVDLCAPESVPDALAALATIAREGQVRDVELVVQRSRAEVRAVRLDASRIQDAKGVVLGAQAIIRDVTVERVLAVELERQRRMLQTIFDSVPAACILVEADGTIAAANPPVERVSPLAAAEMIGRNVGDVFGSGDADTPIQRAFRSGRPEQQVSWLENRRKERVYVHRTAGPVLAEGKVARVVEVTVDVTEQVLAGDLRVLQLWRGRTDRGSKGPDRRAWPRAEASFAARLRHAGGMADVTVENLSQDGLFLRANPLLPIGTEVEVEWTLPSEHARIVAKGVVVWHRPQRGARPAGMGVHFLHISSGPPEILRISP